MIVKCPKCGSDLKFDPITQSMLCEHCHGQFSPEMLGGLNGKKRESVADRKKRLGQTPQPWDYSDYVDEPEEVWGEATPVSVSSDGMPKTDEATDFSDATFEMNIYHCSSCGGEIMVDGLEASTFCPYCGQPTIVFDRTSRELKPKYILPFEVTKEQAIGLIRFRFNHGLFIPREVKNFSVEQIKGIYVPYWLLEIYYKNRLCLKGDVRSKNDDKVHTRYFIRGAEATLTRFPMDASARLIDEYAQRLEPYNLRKLVPFQIQYLSGFYADRYDVGAEAVKAPAIERVGRIFENEIARRIFAENVSVIGREAPDAKVREVEYAMLPVWFMTFRYLGEPYTILVNGQSGKVVGGVPFEKNKMTLIMCLSAVFLSIIAVNMLSSFVRFMEEESFPFLAIVAAAGAAMLVRGIKLLKRVLKSIALTKAEENVHIVSGRGEK